MLVQACVIKTVNHFTLLQIKCNSEYQSALSQKNTKEENKVPQRFKRLIHWFHLNSVRGVLHVLTVETFERYSSAEFLCESYILETAELT